MYTDILLTQKNSSIALKSLSALALSITFGGIVVSACTTSTAMNVGLVCALVTITAVRVPLSVNASLIALDAILMISHINTFIAIIAVDQPFVHTLIASSAVVVIILTLVTTS